MNDDRVYIVIFVFMNSAALFQTAEFVFAGYMLSQFLSQR